MANNTITHSGYAIYYEEHKAYLDHLGIHHDVPNEDCIWEVGPITGLQLANVIKKCRKTFAGNIYVVRVEIKCEKVNNHNFMETNSYDSFLEVFGKRSQKSLEESLARVRKREHELPLKGNTYMHCANKTWIKHCKRYLQENFYNKPKKEVNDGRE